MSIDHTSNAQGSPCSADVTLNELLEEKRRLLCRVSAKLGAKVVSSVLGGSRPLADVGDPAATWEAAAAAPPQICRPPAIARHPGTFAPPPREEPGGDAGGRGVAADFASAVSEELEAEAGALLDLQSLCGSLRDGIERKRLLLDQLQQL